MVKPETETQPLQEWLAEADTVEMVRELQHLAPVARRCIPALVEGSGTRSLPAA